MIKRYFSGLQFISKKEIRKIQKHISLDTDTIKAKHKEFIKKYPDGQVPVSSLFEGESKETCETLIKVMDTNGDGKIDFKEFIVYMGILDSVTQEFTTTNLRWIFKAFDFDNSGTICHKEFMALSKIMLGDDLFNEKHAIDVFNKLDRNSDNELSVDEFVGGMLQIQNLVS